MPDPASAPQRRTQLAANVIHFFAQHVLFSFSLVCAAALRVSIPSLMYFVLFLLHIVFGRTRSPQIVATTTVCSLAGLVLQILAQSGAISIPTLLSSAKIKSKEISTSEATFQLLPDIWICCYCCCLLVGSRRRPQRSPVANSSLEDIDEGDAYGPATGTNEENLLDLDPASRKQWAGFMGCFRAIFCYLIVFNVAVCSIVWPCVLSLVDLLALLALFVYWVCEPPGPQLAFSKGGAALLSLYTASVLIIGYVTILPDIREHQASIPSWVGTLHFEQGEEHFFYHLTPPEGVLFYSSQFLLYVLLGLQSFLPRDGASSQADKTSLLPINASSNVEVESSSRAAQTPLLSVADQAQQGVGVQGALSARRLGRRWRQTAHEQTAHEHAGSQRKRLWRTGVQSAYVFIFLMSLCSVVWAITFPSRLSTPLLVWGLVLICTYGMADPRRTDKLSLARRFAATTRSRPAFVCVFCYMICLLLLLHVFNWYREDRSKSLFGTVPTDLIAWGVAPTYQPWAAITLQLVLVAITGWCGKLIHWPGVPNEDDTNDDAILPCNSSVVQLVNTIACAGTCCSNSAAARRRRQQQPLSINKRSPGREDSVFDSSKFETLPTAGAGDGAAEGTENEPARSNSGSKGRARGHGGRGGGGPGGKGRRGGQGGRGGQEGRGGKGGKGRGRAEADYEASTNSIASPTAARYLKLLQSASEWVGQTLRFILFHLDILVIALLVGIVMLDSDVSLINTIYLLFAVVFIVRDSRFRRRFWRTLIVYSAIVVLLHFIWNIPCGGYNKVLPIVGLRPFRKHRGISSNNCKDPLSSHGTELSELWATPMASYLLLLLLCGLQEGVYSLVDSHQRSFKKRLQMQRQRLGLDVHGESIGGADGNDHASGDPLLRKIDLTDIDPGELLVDHHHPGAETLSGCMLFYARWGYIATYSSFLVVGLMFELGSHDNKEKSDVSAVGMVQILIFLVLVGLDLHHVSPTKKTKDYLHMQPQRERQVWMRIVYLEGALLFIRYVYQFEDLALLMGGTFPSGRRQPSNWDPSKWPWHNAAHAWPVCTNALVAGRACVTLEELGLVYYTVESKEFYGISLRLLRFLPLLTILILCLLQQRSYEHRHLVGRRQRRLLELKKRRRELGLELGLGAAVDERGQRNGKTSPTAGAVGHSFGGVRRGKKRGGNGRAAVEGRVRPVLVLCGACCGCVRMLGRLFTHCGACSSRRRDPSLLHDHEHDIFKPQTIAVFQDWLRLLKMCVHVLMPRLLLILALGMALDPVPPNTDTGGGIGTGGCDAAACKRFEKQCHLRNATCDNGDGEGCGCGSAIGAVGENVGAIGALYVIVVLIYTPMNAKVIHCWIALYWISAFGLLAHYFFQLQMFGPYSCKWYSCCSADARWMGLVRVRPTADANYYTLSLWRLMQPQLLMIVGCITSALTRGLYHDVKQCQSDDAVVLSDYRTRHDKLQQRQRLAQQREMAKLAEEERVQYVDSDAPHSSGISAKSLREFNLSRSMYNRPMLLVALPSTHSLAALANYDERAAAVKQRHARAQARQKLIEARAEARACKNGGGAGAGGGTGTGAGGGAGGASYANGPQNMRPRRSSAPSDRDMNWKAQQGSYEQQVMYGAKRASMKAARTTNYYQQHFFLANFRHFMRFHAVSLAFVAATVSLVAASFWRMNLQSIIYMAIVFASLQRTEAPPVVVRKYGWLLLCLIWVVLLIQYSRIILVPPSLGAGDGNSGWELYKYTPWKQLVDLPEWACASNNEFRCSKSAGQAAGIKATACCEAPLNTSVAPSLQWQGQSDVAFRYEGNSSTKLLPMPPCALQYEHWLGIGASDRTSLLFELFCALFFSAYLHLLQPEGMHFNRRDLMHSFAATAAEKGGNTRGKYTEGARSTSGDSDDVISLSIIELKDETQQLLRSSEERLRGAIRAGEGGPMTTLHEDALVDGAAAMSAPLLAQNQEAALTTGSTAANLSAPTTASAASAAEELYFTFKPVPGDCGDFASPTNSTAWHFVNRLFMSYLIKVVLIAVFASAATKADIFSGGYMLFSIFFLYFYTELRKRGNKLFIWLCIYNWLELFMQAIVQVPLLSPGPANPWCQSGSTGCWSWLMVLGMFQSNHNYFRDYIDGNKVCGNSTETKLVGGQSIMYTYRSGTETIVNLQQPNLAPVVNFYPSCQSKELYPTYSLIGSIVIFVLCSIQTKLFASEAYKVYIAQDEHMEHARDERRARRARRTNEQVDQGKLRRWRRMGHAKIIQMAKLKHIVASIVKRIDHSFQSSSQAIVAFPPTKLRVLRSSPISVSLCWEAPKNLAINLISSYKVFRFSANEQSGVQVFGSEFGEVEYIKAQDVAMIKIDIDEHTGRYSRASGIEPGMPLRTEALETPAGTLSMVHDTMTGEDSQAELWCEAEVKGLTPETEYTFVLLAISLVGPGPPSQSTLEVRTDPLPLLDSSVQGFALVCQSQLYLQDCVSWPSLSHKKKYFQLLVDTPGTLA
jgi:hypothetical protein